MPVADVVIIGAGQAGLAMSRQLGELGIDHVILERGRVAERWRTAAWWSLRLLTPNWMTRLPDWQYRGNDPDGYMDRHAFVRFLTDYAGAVAAPVITDAQVMRVSTIGDHGYAVETTVGTWRCRAVVIATGHCDRPWLPDSAAALDPALEQVHSAAYRDPSYLAPGGVLVVGASASAVQIALELAQAGRRVILAAGRHTPLPRRYLGRDIFWWLDRTGVLTERATEMPNLGAARRQPSLQLAGRADGLDVDLRTLERNGVRIAGRLQVASETSVCFAGSLVASIRRAERKRDRLLADMRGLASRLALDAAAAPIEPFTPASPPVQLDLRAEGIASIVWATGFSRDYSWLDLPAVANGELIHDGGVLPLPGLFALGLRFMRRRNSSFVDGVGADAADLADMIAARLGVSRRLAA
jgi:putative flavoprotein involved in K+ transport